MNQTKIDENADAEPADGAPLTKSPVVKLLHDEPSSDDLFGGHHRAGRSLPADDPPRHARAAHPRADRRRAGSGKSTTVGLVADRLKNNPKPIPTFLFDAWGHQGDSLRRAFLEALVENAKVNEWVGPDKIAKLDDACTALAQKRRKNLTRPTPQSPITALLFWISVLLVPVAFLALQGSGVAKNLAAPEFLGPLIENKWLWVMFAPIGVVALHIVLGLIFYGLRRTPRVRALFSIPVLDAHTAFGEQPLRSAARLVRRIDAETEAEHIDDLDPTTLEFQKQFFAVADELLDEPGTRLLIVVDNLDRLEPNSAITLWANLGVFFVAASGGNHKSVRDRIWLCIAYDQQEMKRAFTASEFGKDAFAGFCTKTFQVTYRVPPILLTDWHEYMEGRLVKAMPELTQEVITRVVQVFDCLRVPKNLPPTPRSIIRFINDLGGVYRTWHSYVPLPIQAIYVLRMRDMEPEEARDSLTPVGKELLEDLPLSTVTDEARYLLAAMYFGNEEGKARQFLLPYDIEAAALTGEASAFDHLKEVVGFEKVLLRVVSTKANEWVRGSGACDLFVFAKAVENVELVSAQIYEELWSLVLDRAKAVRAISIFGRGEGEGIARTINRAGDEGLCRSLVHCFCAARSSGGNAPDEVRKWAREATSIFSLLDETFCGVLKNDFDFVVSPDQYWLVVDEVSVLSDWRHLGYLRLRDRKDAEKVMAELLQAISDMKVDMLKARTIVALTVSGSLEDTNSFCAKICNVLSFEQSDFNCAARLLLVLARTRTKSGKGTDLRGLGNAFHLHHWAQVIQASADKSYSATADVLAVVYGRTPTERSLPKRNTAGKVRAVRQAHSAGKRYETILENEVPSGWVKAVVDLDLGDELRLRAAEGDFVEAKLAQKIVAAVEAGAA